MATNTFVVTDITLFDGENEIPDSYVHVENGKIKAVGPSSSITPPSDVKVISKPGHTIVPGFIDAHNHADKGKEMALYQALSFGVTTFMDLHNEIPNVKKLRKVAQDERKKAADFKTAGIAATIENGWPVPVVLAHDQSPEVRKP